METVHHGGAQKSATRHDGPRPGGKAARRRLHLVDGQPVSRSSAAWPRPNPGICVAARLPAAWARAKVATPEYPDLASAVTRQSA